MYSVDSIVKFFDLDDDVIMQTGTHQGRCTFLLTFDAISLLFAKYRVKDLQNMDRIPLQRTLDAEAERDAMEQTRRQRAAREAREEEEREIWQEKKKKDDWY